MTRLTHTPVCACRAEVQKCLAGMNCPEYFEAVEARLAAEEERADALLDGATSKAKLAQLLLDVYVASQVRRLPGPACAASRWSRLGPLCCMRPGPTVRAACGRPRVDRAVDSIVDRPTVRCWLLACYKGGIIG